MVVGNSSYNTLWFCKTSKHYTVGFLSFVWLRFHDVSCPSMFVHEIFRLRNIFSITTCLQIDPVIRIAICHVMIVWFIFNVFQIFIAHQRNCGNAMFSVVCVCLFTGVCHVTITHDALDFTIQGPSPASPGVAPPQPGTSLYREPPPPGQTLLPSANMWWLIKHYSSCLS